MQKKYIFPIKVSNLILFVLVIGSILSFFFFDKLSLTFVERFPQKTRYIWKIFSFFCSESLHVIIWFMAFIICRFILCNHRLAPIFFEFVVAISFSEGFIHLFKYILGKARPILYLTEGKFGFYFFKSSGTYHSFPSGHTSIAFLVATLASIYLPRFRFYFFGLALLLSLSRVFLLKHYIGDVMGTIVIAYVIGHVVHWAFQKITKNI